MYARKYYLAVSILISETFHSLRPDHPAPPFFFKCVCVGGGHILYTQTHKYSGNKS